jgi:hypothetical protein
MQNNKSVKKMSNEEFLSHICSYSKAGPMAQIIMVHAILSYLRTKDTAMLDNLDNLFDKKAWVKACEILEKEFKEKYDS